MHAYTRTHANTHTHTHTYKSIAEMEGGSTINSELGGGSFGTSSSGIRGTGAVDFSTAYTIVSTLYTTHYSTYRAATINHSESHKRPQVQYKVISMNCICELDRGK